MRRVAPLVALVLSMGAIPWTASAQAISSRADLSGVQQTSLFARDRNVSVLERRRPEYEAAGAQFGAFWVFPKIEGDIEYNDNIYAVGTGKTSDVIFRVRPQILVQSDWSRHSLSAHASGTFNEYTSHSTESTTDWDFGSDARLDIVRGSDISFGADASKLTESRISSGSPTDAVRPVQYLNDSAYLAAEREVNRIKLSVRGGWNHLDYLSVPSINGGIINEDFRDRNVYGVTGRADYAMSPDTALFVELTGNWREYRLNPEPLSPRQDSKGYNALVGANFELTAVLRGEIAVGYIAQDYTAAAYGDVSGIGARAKVEWFPSALTTVTATVSRSVEEAAVVGSGGYLSTNAGIQVDHELLRNVILSGNATYGNDSYNGIDRTDHRFQASAGATYLLNRRVGLNARYIWYKQTSQGAAFGPEFTVNRVMGGLVLQF